MPLTFPIKYADGPTVIFIPYEYKFPEADATNSPVERGGLYEGIEPVSLYLPGNFNENIGSDWGMQEIIGGATSSTSVADMTALETVQAGKKALGAKVTSTISAHSDGGSIAMPMDLLIYTGPKAIDLSFAFELVPINNAESTVIMQILTNFKQATRPKQGKDKTTSLPILKYPPIWDIEFYGIQGLGVSKPNSYTWMALSNVTVSYSGDTNIHVYDISEHPVKVNLNLSFMSIKKFNE